MQFACVGPDGADGARLEAMCQQVGVALGAALEREVLQADPADVVVEVVRVDEARAVARLRWTGAEAGPEVEVAVMDAALNERAVRMMVEGLLKVSPSP